jgi:polar amino acid transport system substrate-binding protein
MNRENSSASGAALAAASELAPGGKLRVGVVYAPTVSTFFVTLDDARRPHGVTVDLGNALAAQLSVPAEFMAVPNSGEVTDALERGAIDVAFMPVDDERKKRVAFGPAYFLLESTCLVHGDSPFKTTTDLDRAGARIAGIANTTTIRSAARVLSRATIVSVPSVEAAMDLLRRREAEGVALSRDVLVTYVAGIAGSRMVDGQLHATGIAIAVAKGRPASLACVSEFMAQAKQSGVVRQAFDRSGLHAEAVAPEEQA